VLAGGQATIIGASIHADNSGGPGDSFGIRAVDSTIVLRESDVQARTVGATAAYAVWLERSIDVELATSMLGATSLRGVDVSAAPASFASISVTGAAANLNIHDNIIGGTADIGAPAGIELNDCAGDEPWIHHNESIHALGGYKASGNDFAAVKATAIRSQGDCHPRIEANGRIAALGPYLTEGVGIHCSNAAPSGVPSRCRILDNASIYAGSEPSQLRGTGTGVHCEGGSCLEITGNWITGLSATIPSPTTGCIRSCQYRSTGIRGGGSATLIDANEISQGCGAGAGISGSGARIQNNVISGRSCPGLGTSAAISGGGDIHSNSLSGGGVELDDFFPEGCTSVAAIGGYLRNNSLSAGNCYTRQVLTNPSYASHNYFNDDDGGGYPTLVLAGGTGMGSGLTTVEEVNAYFATTGNISSGSLIDAGTPDGAPDHDADGNPRNPMSPDIGPHEQGDYCPEEDCSGHGQCVHWISGEMSCTCDAGYVRADDDPLSCVVDA
jgi:hypothetical protein